MKLAMRSAVLAATIVGCFACPALAGATTINVTTATDTSADDGQCTLREAITAANTNAAVGPTDPVDCPAGSAGPTVDTIVIPVGDYVTSTGAGEDANATGDFDVDLAGGPVVLSGANNTTTILHNTNAGDRLLDVHGSGDFTVESLKVFNGFLTTGGSGAGINVPDGADTTLTNVVLNGNRTQGSDGTALGGGIYADGGSLTVDHSVIGDNQVTFNANAGTGDGSQVGGGGIYVTPGTPLSVDYSSFTGNKVTSSNKETFVSGGAISAINASEPVSITRSFFQNNNSTLQASGGAGTNAGAAIAWDAGDTGDTLALENDTFDGNASSGSLGVPANGGGVYAKGGVVHAANLTFGPGNATGGLYWDDDGGDLFIRGSIFAKAGCAGDDVTSQGYNLEEGAGSFPTCNFDQPTDIMDTPQVLGSTVIDTPPSSHGGPTFVFGLKEDSPARDAIPAAECLGADGTALATDQRGVTRANEANCDLGAFEDIMCDGQAVNIVGTDGDDFLEGTDDDDGILALAGNDTITNLSYGHDKVCAGPGDDVYKPDANNVADSFFGGDGTDTVDMSAIHESANISVGAGIGSVTSGHLGVDLLSSVENGIGTDHVDNLIGDGTPNVLTAGEEGDRIVPGGGADTVFGQGGQDQIFIRDGVGDTVDCGDAVDTVEADNQGVDSLVNCEVANFEDAIDPNDLYHPKPPKLFQPKPRKCPKAKRKKGKKRAAVSAKKKKCKRKKPRKKK